MTEISMFYFFDRVFNKSLNIQRMSISDQQLRSYIDQVFAQFDKDGSGSLDVNELAAFFNAVFSRMGDPTRINDYEAR